MADRGSIGVRSPLEDALKLISNARIALFALAAIQALGVVFLRRFPLFGDVVVLALLGFLLGFTKSRAIAVMALAYVLFVLTLTFLQHLGLYKGSGGSNVILAGIGAYYAWLGVQGTRRYHRLLNTRVRTRSIVILSLVAVLLSALALVAALLVLVWIGYDFDQDIDDTLLGGVVLGTVGIVTLFVFMRWLPFTSRLKVTEPDDSTRGIIST